ncbi:cation diffusion facilitator family transporter [Haladaptatus caseinilyticus]|uniref:cation diffusion facilitator family transporter n=1 Tax=Haladaptatus caseinilyticus TaxID=2993314 RepID=UPI00224B02C9|nr:cation diffusion facilitator family transporter [Haladaptatus caseinilyticus]
MASSKSVVIAALLANGAIAVLKFIGYLLTLSPAMLSETYHSISDTGNQVFLLIGIRYSGREATRGHPFGYGKAQFFYSFLVSVLLFGIAGWESAKHGYNALMHPHAEHIEPVHLLGQTFDPIYVNYAVLIGAILFESYAFIKAYKAMKIEINRRDWSGFREAFRKTSDVTTLTALTEDTIALCGAGIALFGVYLSRVTGNPMYDAASALLIGLMLMGFAVALAWENKRLLLGESLPEEEEDELRIMLDESDGVTEIIDFRTVYFGPGKVIIAADVAFDPELDTGEMDDRITHIENEMFAANDHVKKVYIEPEVQEGDRRETVAK